MFRVKNNASLVAVEDKALLKRVMNTPSSKLPSDEVCHVPNGSVVKLSGPPVEQGDYMLVRLLKGQVCAV